MSSIVGTRLSHYEINSLLGSGGMGEVYLAQDTVLGRPVALKLLSAKYIMSRDRLRRFEQEARATSALNHPNILTIYEFGKVEAKYYIAAEFVDGITLRRLLGQGRISITEVLDIVAQVAAALVAAHSKGILHRDIKPENIMLRTDGYVKVLDFGLAKLLESDQRASTGPEMSTVTNIDTDEGAIIGTVAYMSPEQLRAQEVDERTDIWSLGVVMYEMVVGCLPFIQHSKGNLIVSILEREALPFEQHAPEVPSELQRIITKALCKNREGRYQTAEELLLELKRFKEAYGSGNYSGSHQRAATTDGEIAALTSPNQSPVNTLGKSVRTNTLESARPTYSVEYFVSKVTSHKLSALLVILILLGIGGLAYQRIIKIKRASVSSSTPAPQFTKLALSSNIRQAAISPDGRYVVTVSEDAGRQGLAIRQLSASTDVQIVEPTADQYRDPIFSRDGEYIFYLKKEKNAWNLYRVPVIGGTERRLITNLNTGVALSPRGDQLAFVRDKAAENATSLIIANVEGGGEREVVTRALPNVFALSSSINSIVPAWSPDGKVIACPTLNFDEAVMGIAEVRVESGEVRQIISQTWQYIEHLSWLSDGSGLVMNAMKEEWAPFQIWFISYPDGAVRGVTNDLDNYESVSLTADSNFLLSVQSSLITNLWIISGENKNQATQVVSSKNTGIYGISWMPDGRILYSSRESGKWGVWVMDASGRNRKQLTFDNRTDLAPVATQDGRYIVFTSYWKGAAHVWRMDADGTKEQQLTNGSYEDAPQCSPDGRWIVYHSIDSFKNRIMKMPIDGGPAVSLSERPAIQPVVSPDGKLVACFSREAEDTSPWKIAIIPFEGGPPVKWFDVAQSVAEQFQGMRWTPDGRALTYIVTSGNVSNLFAQPLSGGPPKPLTDFKEQQILAFAWSSKDNKLCFVRSLHTKDPIAIKQFR